MAALILRETFTATMIRYFVEDTRDPALSEENRSVFQGLKIMEMGEKYTSQIVSFIGPMLQNVLNTVASFSLKSPKTEKISCYT